MPHNSDNSEQEFLKNYNINDYDRPSITVDTATFAIRSETAESYRHDTKRSLSILLVKRDNHPYSDYYSLPGGFLQKNQDIKDCAIQTIKNKTQIDPIALMPIGYYSNKTRDPRGWIVSNAFISILNEMPSDISDNAAWYDVHYNFNSHKNIEVKLIRKNKDIIVIKGKYVKTEFGVPIYKILTHELAFDHDQILLDALIKLLNISDNLNIILDFMPDKFTLSSIQNVIEAITGKEIAAANFRRKIIPFVKETDEYIIGVGHRPAKLFIRS